MPALLGANKAYDAYGHPTDAQTQINSGFSTATTGSAAGTVVQTATADPTGTTNITQPYQVSDGYGQFQITTAGTQTTGSLRTVFFQNPYPVLRPVLVVISTTAGVTGATAGGTVTVTMSLTSLNFSIGTALTTATTYNISYVIL
jgi:hypothetical protein